MRPMNQRGVESISSQMPLTIDPVSVSQMRARLLGYLQSNKLEPMEEDLMEELTVPQSPPRSKLDLSTIDLSPVAKRSVEKLEDAIELVRGDDGLKLFKETSPTALKVLWKYSPHQYVNDNSSKLVPEPKSADRTRRRKKKVMFTASRDESDLISDRKQ